VQLLYSPYVITHSQITKTTSLQITSNTHQWYLDAPSYN